MIYKLSYKEFLLLLPQNFNLKQFLHYAKVKQNTYFGRLFERYYTLLTKNSFNLLTEYEKYYKVEYGLFKSYLRNKYPTLEDDIINEISTFIDSKNYILCKNINYSFSDSNLTQLLDYSDNFTEIISSLLKERYNEN